MQGYNLPPDGTTPSFIHLDAINAKSVLEAALDYRDRGFVVTPLRGNRPILGRWPERVLSQADLPRYFADERNVGVVFGGLGGIVDVDLDNPAAVAVADLLPPDTLESGRAAIPRSHRWYLGGDVPAARKYALPKLMAERLKLQPGEIREISGEELAGLVLDVAIAALLALSRPLGSRKWFAVHAVGYLNPRLGSERAEKVVEAASMALDDEEHAERMLAVRSVLGELVGADPATDAALAAELERLAPGVPGLVSRSCARNRHDQGGAR